MARITFTGADLADFASPGHDDHLKLFFPGATSKDEPCKRDYTPRRFDVAARQLIIDFVLHDGGPATSWAKMAVQGDVLEIGGPRGSTIVTDDFDWYLLVGDETALPAITRRVEELRLGACVTTVIVVNDVSEVQPITTQADWRARWVLRASEGGDDAAIAAADCRRPCPAGGRRLRLDRGRGGRREGASSPYAGGPPAPAGLAQSVRLLGSWRGGGTFELQGR